MSLPLDAVLAGNAIHTDAINEDQHDEDIDRPLLGEPEAERCPSDGKLVEKIAQQDAGAKRHGKPDSE